MTNDARHFASHLMEGETLLWTGRPRQGLAWRSDDAAKTPFSLLWLAFVLCWLWVARAMGAGPLMIGAGMLFAVVGVYFVVGRFFADAIARTRVHYAVTERRALIVAGARLTSVELQDIRDLHFAPGGGGRGTITFGTPQRGVVGSYSEAFKPRSPEFFQTKGAGEAYALMRRIRNDA